MVKYNDHYPIGKFKLLERLLSQEQHHLVEGLYVFVAGLKTNIVLDLLK